MGVGGEAPGDKNIVVGIINRPTLPFMGWVDLFIIISDIFVPPFIYLHGHLMYTC